MFNFFYQLGPKLCCSNNTTGPYYICILYIWVKCTMALPKYSIPVYIYIYLCINKDRLSRGAKQLTDNPTNKLTDRKTNR